MGLQLFALWISWSTTFRRCPSGGSAVPRALASQRFPLQRAAVGKVGWHRALDSDPGSTCLPVVLGKPLNALGLDWHICYEEQLPSVLQSTFIFTKKAAFVTICLLMRDRSSGNLSDYPWATMLSLPKGMQWLVAKSPVFTLRAAPGPAWPLGPRRGVALNTGWVTSARAEDILLNAGKPLLILEGSGVLDGKKEPGSLCHNCITPLLMVN